jgi:hypothetical protein
MLLFNKASMNLVECDNHGALEGLWDRKSGHTILSVIVLVLASRQVSTIDILANSGEIEIAQIVVKADMKDAIFFVLPTNKLLKLRSPL